MYYFCITCTMNFFLLFYNIATKQLKITFGAHILLQLHSDTMYSHFQTEFLSLLPYIFLEIV